MKNNTDFNEIVDMLGRLSGPQGCLCLKEDGGTKSYHPKEDFTATYNGCPLVSIDLQSDKGVIRAKSSERSIKDKLTSANLKGVLIFKEIKATIKKKNNAKH